MQRNQDEGVDPAHMSDAESELTATVDHLPFAREPGAGDAAPAAGERRVGRYLMGEMLGAGGMAHVHLGRFIAPGGVSRPVAIKRLDPSFGPHPEARTMLLDEARVVARVQHPNVVALLDVVEERDDVFLVFDYIRGETLAELQRTRGPAPADVAVAVLIGVLEGLHAAHGATDDAQRPLGIVHRDVSPQNILVGADGTVRVLDFGIAKARGRAQEATRTGLVKGKPAYMAPEQFRTGLAGVRSDVFSCGLVLWEVLVGRRVFDAADHADLKDQVLSMEIRRLREERPSLPPALDEAVATALARDPAFRFDSARAFAVALELAVAPATPRGVAEWFSGAHAGDRDRAHVAAAPGVGDGLARQPRARSRSSVAAVALGGVATAAGIAVLLARGTSGDPAGVAATSSAPSASIARTSSAPVEAPTATPSTGPAVVTSAVTSTIPAVSATAAAHPDAVGGTRRPSTRTATPKEPTCRLVPEADGRGVIKLKRICE